MNTDHQSGLNRLERASGRNIFGADAAGYHAGRIGYPDALYDAVLARVPAGPDILEIGAGSGLATEQLLARNLRSLTVVEPAPALVAFIADRLHDPRLAFVTGAFPDVPVDGPFDLAVCAAAFHWMEPTAALARIAAVLRPGGAWAMWWNSYRNTGVGDALSDAITPLLRDIALPPSEGIGGHYSLDTTLHRGTLEAAGFGRIEQHVFRHERSLDVDQVIALYESYSYVRLLPDDQRSALLSKIATLVREDFDGVAPNVVLTACYIAQRPE